jgi:hypothetical protein
MIQGLIMPTVKIDWHQISWDQGTQGNQAGTSVSRTFGLSFFCTKITVN